VGEQVVQVFLLVTCVKQKHETDARMNGHFRSADISEIWVQIGTRLSFVQLTRWFRFHDIFLCFQSSAKRRCFTEDHTLWGLLC
jgi:hypothetical protein